MVQELIDLKQSIVEGRYQDALDIIDELEGMGKQAILRNIESFLVRLLIHLIKNQLEKRLTNSWIASISDSIIQIKKLNLKDNKKSYYIKQAEWLPYLEEAIEVAIRPVSVEVLNGGLKPAQISAQIQRDELINISQKLLDLTYIHTVKDLPNEIDQQLVQLPGGAEWFS
ncbi:protein of unknown function DUF29 [Stanieria cyanosphaera PCC 7437]|uniref:DUF29 family protein n=1 Tax=Stanieria cyanosphaera (strain ATCC 29371 / PCC 7437) TaxID=111780 RepID=K9XP39_STAC7|nr:DUF29 family protein [Stanieria cyanosphaera]AFZ33849.1 protein of unknown function DUF29 [Stanieria cyanosphaera PCC 7437]